MSLTLLPYPDGVTWQDWLDNVVGYNADLVNQVSADLDWLSFAHRLTQFVPDAPAPERFGDWPDWVRALKQALNL